MILYGQTIEEHKCVTDQKGKRDEKSLLDLRKVFGLIVCLMAGIILAGSISVFAVNIEVANFWFLPEVSEQCKSKNISSELDRHYRQYIDSVFE